MEKTQVVAAIIQKDNKFLLGKRSLQKNSSPGKWSPISGKVEPGETESAALERECLEEIGLVIKAVKKISEFDIENGKTRIHWWTTSIVSGEAFLRNDEHSQLRWFSIDELATEENINPQDLQVFNTFADETMNLKKELTLISPKPEDAWFWLQVRGQKTTQINNPIGILSEEKLRAQISESNSDITEKKSVHRYYIQTKEKDFAGVISLKDINWESGVCEIGYLIAEKYQNKGVATRAVELIVQKAFAAGIKKIKATTFVKNVASYKALQKNGFALEGYLKNEALIQGQLQDMFLWAASLNEGRLKTYGPSSEIRSAVMTDTEAIHKLCFQLGYDPVYGDVQSRLAQILIHPDYEVLVIERNKEVLGWMSLFKRLYIEDVEFLQVAALVTDERIRGQGLGKSLMAFAEARANELKLPFVGLSSSIRRAEAHKFYEGIGYSKSKESYFFKKDLSAQ